MSGDSRTELNSLVSRSALVSAVEAVGQYGVNLWHDLHGMVGLLYDTVAAFVSSDRRSYSAATRQMTSQILFTGVEALWLVSCLALVCGITIVVQAATNMPRFGVSEYFGEILVMALVRELAPFFTTLVVIGRSGSALATYIASMKVSKEVAALRVMGIDPIHFIVLPAFVGMIVSIMSLSVYFDIVGIVGGLTVASFTARMPFGIFVEKVLVATTWIDLVLPLVKSFVFGIIVAIVCCYQGLQAENPRQVPRAARRAVVGSMVAALLVNVIVTIGMYGK